MSIVLTVTSAFGDYPRGAQITEPQKVQDVLDSEQHEKVVKSEVPDAPKAEAVATLSAAPAAAADPAPTTEHEEPPAA